MKKLLFSSLGILIIVLSSCTEKKINIDNPLCDIDNPLNCNITCVKDADCGQACPIGCINNNQDYIDPEDIICSPAICQCVSNKCVPFYNRPWNDYIFNQNPRIFRKNTK